MKNIKRSSKHKKKSLTKNVHSQSMKSVYSIANLGHWLGCDIYKYIWITKPSVYTK